MQKTYIFIDDSGDPGFTGATSSNFIIASVVVVGEEKCSLLVDAVNLFRRNLGWHENEELKFNKTRKKIIKDAIGFMAPFDYEAYALVLDKSKMNRSKLPDTKKESVYMFVIKELLLKLSLDNAVIVIDGSYGKKYIKATKVYLRQHLKSAGILGCEIKFSDSKKNVLVQVADLVAGSVARSFSDKKDANEYVKAFGKKLKKIFRI